MIGGIPDVDAAQRYLLKSFGEGKLGRWTLDDLMRDPAAFMDAGDSNALTVAPVANESAEELSITSAVDRSVSTYLKEQADRRALKAEGIPESLAQEKKKARKSAVEERKKKWEAKMANAGGVAPGSKKQRR